MCGFSAASHLNLNLDLATISIIELQDHVDNKCFDTQGGFCWILPVHTSSRIVPDCDDNNDGDAHCLSGYPDFKHLISISQTCLTEESFLVPMETTEPQSKSLQAAAASCTVQPEAFTGFHVPSFTSSVPSQRLAPPTNLTGSEHKSDSHQ